MLHLEKASENDLLTISNLADVIWNQHYVPIIGQAQVNYMLNKMYSLTSLKEQIHTKNHVIYLIKNDGNDIGFISVEKLKDQDYFLHKFYIDQQQSNKGTGTRALGLLIELIHPKSLTLTVNRQNFKSVNFYFKNGFKIEKVEDFDIGNNYQMNDFVMVKKCS
ncbi:MAG: acetyltransferase [Bacteroidota bacterium]|jgi:GNAT superfamily N-acetyltransferase|nr:acetyltransferase [Bacteroidota bacterium]